MSCSCTHESKIRKPRSSATVPGPIGVHESAANPSSSSSRSWAMRASVVATNSASASAPDQARRDSIQRSLDRPMSFFTWGRSSGTSSVGSGSPRIEALERGDVHEVVLHAPARALRRCLPLGLVERRPELGHRAPHVLEHVDEMRCSQRWSSAIVLSDPESHPLDGVVGALHQDHVAALADREDVLLQVHEVDRRPHLAGERVGLRSASTRRTCGRTTTSSVAASATRRQNRCTYHSSMSAVAASR